MKLNIIIMKSILHPKKIFFVKSFSKKKPQKPLKKPIHYLRVFFSKKQNLNYAPTTYPPLEAYTPKKISPPPPSWR